MPLPPAQDRLPEPDADAQAASRLLVEQIVGEIETAGGAIGFDRFMELALYAPALGYYSGGATKFGPAGDFTTAPEISALFGRCVARQVAEVIDELGGGDVLELGGGTGALAEAALAEFEAAGRGPGAWIILEPSAELKGRQRARLGGRVRWIDTPPREFSGVVLGNEVADALPVERFCIRGGEVLELCVGWSGDRFTWVERPAAPALEIAVRRVMGPGLAGVADGYSSEVCLRLGPWMESLAEILERGLVLLSDYGLPRTEYYAGERREGTLVCHYRHRAHADPFAWPGLQDITAWVDFTALAEAATGAGLVLEGFTTQAAFLAANGLAEMVAAAPDDARRARLANEARQLVLPGEMGERLRFIGFSRGVEKALEGFGLVDLASRL